MAFICVLFKFLLSHFSVDLLTSYVSYFVSFLLLLQVGHAQMLKGDVIMDVMNPKQARIAQAARACAVMALERIPANICQDGGVTRMSDPNMIEAIKVAVTIPVMTKCNISHMVEALILEAIDVDYINESEVLTPADDVHQVNKHKFNVPFVNGCLTLGADHSGALCNMEKRRYDPHQG